MTELRAFKALQRTGSSAQNSPKENDLVEMKLYVRLTNVTCNKMRMLFSTTQAHLPFAYEEFIIETT